MPTYDYFCSKCQIVEEIVHSMSDDSPRLCSECKIVMLKQIGRGGYVIIKGGTVAAYKEKEHTKKAKDMDRAVKRRKRLFGHDAVGDPVDKPDSKHLVRKGKTIAGQQKEVDKAELVKALAKDDWAVKVAKDIVVNHPCHKGMIG